MHASFGNFPILELCKLTRALCRLEAKKAHDTCHIEVLLEKVTGSVSKGFRVAFSEISVGNLSVNSAGTLTS